MPIRGAFAADELVGIHHALRLVSGEVEESRFKTRVACLGHYRQVEVFGIGHGRCLIGLPVCTNKSFQELQVSACLPFISIGVRTDTVYSLCSGVVTVENNFGVFCQIF